MKRDKEKKRKREERKKEERLAKCQVNMKTKEAIVLNRDYAVIECESTRISDQKHDKMLQCVSSGVPIPIKSFAVIKDMSSRLDSILIAWAQKIFFWEETKLVLSDGCMVGDGPCCSST